jgi:tetratricopeptide (TPR) repeat protein
MRTSTLGLLWLLSFLLVAVAEAHAADIDDQARTHFEAAQSHFETGSYEDAIREFEAAYRLSGRVALLYNVYLCHERLGNLEAAIDYLARYLEADPETSNAAALRSRLEKLRARAAVAHEQREPETPEPLVARPEPTPLPVDEGPQPGNRYKPAVIASLTIGGLGLASFGAFALLTGREDARLAATCGDACSDEEVATLRRDGLLADMSLGIGAAGLLVGGVLWWLGRPPALTVAPVAARGNLGLLAEGRF